MFTLQGFFPYLPSRAPARAPGPPRGIPERFRGKFASPRILPGAPKLKEMEQVTGLTAHMVRYRREKPEYKKFLEIAVKERKEQARKTFQLRAPSTFPPAIPKPTLAPSTRPNIPTLPRSPCTPPSSLPSVIATPSKSTTLNVDIPDGNVLPTTVKRKASTSPATVKHRTTRPRTESVGPLTVECSPPVKEVPTTAPAVTASVTSKRKRETSSPPGTPSPQRQRLFRLNSSPADSSGRSMTDLTTPPTLTTTGRTRSSSELDQYTADEGSPNNFALPAYGTDVTILQKLTRLRSEADPATKALIDVALQADTRGFRDVDGTFANILLMEHYVKARRAEGKSFNVVSLDVRKAFDT
ncbi:hypothetical protein CBL_20298, partial [Carabus blaptoides fortunei]